MDLFKKILPENNSVGVPESSGQRMRRRRRAIRGFAAEMAKQRDFGQKLADSITGAFGTIVFLLINVVFFVFWILVNTGVFPVFSVFDPFPFGLLTMIVSLEAIFLAVCVLISQNREAEINDLREEVDLQVNLISEEEITKVLTLLSKLYEHLKIPVEDDPELQAMMKPLNTKEIEERLRDHQNFK